ncbi:MAG: DUF2752 domain-containing protein, partial [Bacteroidales bacterium]|nr:DUF2752 domain-containing protein [Bacteroidales bacterium]
ANFFDNGRSMCLSVLLFNKTCPACGSTRGVQHLLHFDVVTATEYNKFSVILLPILLIVYFYEIYRMIKYFKMQKKAEQMA